MKEQVEKIIMSFKERFNNLSDSQKLITYVISLVILIILVMLVSNINIKSGIIDYKKFDFSSIKDNYVENEDRIVYLQAEEVIKNLIAAEKGLYYIDNKKVKIDDFYKYSLYVDFKKFISKSNFKKSIKELGNDFSSEYSLDNPYELVEKKIIDKIYVFDNNMYMVELNLNGNNYFIGLYIKNSYYSIFYVGK